MDLKGGDFVNAHKIGQRLIKLRGSRTQLEISRKVGMSVSAIGMYERGERIPRDEVKVKLARLYNSTVDEIFYAENDTDSVESVTV